MAIQLKHVNRFKDRHGKVRHYFRKPGCPTIALPGEPDSPEFLQAYLAAVTGAPAPATAIAPRGARGTVDALVTDYLGSAAFKGLRPATQESRQYILMRFCRGDGHEPLFAEGAGKRTMLLTRVHVQTIVNRMAGKGGGQRNLRNALSAMFKWAMADEKWRLPDNPAAGVTHEKIKGDGYAPWPAADVARFKLKYPLGTKPYLALMLGRVAGQRRGDIVRLGPRDVQDGWLSFMQQKTGQAVDLRMADMAALQEAIEACPGNGDVFLTKNDGKAFSPKEFSDWFRDRRKAAGISKRLCFHGLRKTKLTELGDNGATPHEIMAVSGHKTLSEVQRYTASFDRRKLAARAMARMA
jgi:integrase